jgi:hypothetical protein
MGNRGSTKMIGAFGCWAGGESKDPGGWQFAGKMFGKTPLAPVTALPWVRGRGDVVGPMEAAETSE